jgi:hypothetical protein
MEDIQHTAWPALPFEAWKDTQATLHLMTQIVGKIRLALTPWCNHSWHVALYVTARGLTTSPIGSSGQSFQIDFDFIDHALKIACADGNTRYIGLGPKTIADFHREVMDALASLGIEVRIHGAPNELAEVIPFAEDRVHAAYDPLYAQRFWRILLQVDRLFKQFRSRYLGKVSPVHFFWGSFDLAVSRFSGATAPLHPGGAPNCPDWIMQEAYSHEVSSCGFWPGSDAMPEPAFYSYAYPAPAGFANARLRPASARFDTNLGEFILPYDAVRQATDPDKEVLDFLQSTYEAAAQLGQWPAGLERASGMPR